VGDRRERSFWRRNKHNRDASEKRPRGSRELPISGEQRRNDELEWSVNDSWSKRDRDRWKNRDDETSWRNNVSRTNSMCHHHHYR